MIGPGDLLCGRFRVDGAPIGEGRTGVVWPAVDEQTGRLVAVKALHEHLVRGDAAAAIERLQAEVGVAARLQHRHVLAVLGLWAHEGRWLLVSERIEGQSLERVLDVGLAPEAVVALGLQLAAALRAAHGSGVVHGDVRAGNVIVGPSGAVLYDFGTMALADGRAGWTGSPGETAPEVLDGGPPGVPADLYGLGVVLWHALAGRRPFSGPTPWAVIGRQREGKPPSPPGPKGLAALVVALIDPDPTKRPPDADTVHRALLDLSKDPGRRPKLSRRRLAPLRLGGPWLVHGVDPSTGAPAVVRADLSLRRARALADRLRASGWDVRVAKEGLGGFDVALALVVGLVGFVAIPILGGPLGVLLALWWRSRSTRPALREALPAVRAPVPPRRVAPNGEYLVTAGLLLLVTAVLLWLWPALAALPGALAAVVLVGLFRRQRRDLVEEASRARVETAIEEARRAIDARPRALEEGLALLGELEHVEAEWRSARSPGDEALLAVEALAVRARETGAPPEVGAGRALAALRRSRTPIERVPTPAPAGPGGGGGQQT